MKYIITKDEDVIVFPDHLKHSDIAFKFNGAVSAGFINIDNVDTEKARCFGESISLNLKSRTQDSAIAERQLITN